MKGIHRFNKKEKTIFWSAALIGLAGGVLGNLFSNILLQIFFLFVRDSWWALLIIVFAIGTAFYWMVYKIVNEIEKNRPLVRKNK